MIWQVQAFNEEYSQAATAQTPCLLIPGWSFDAGIFEWLLPGLAQQFEVSTAHIRELPESVGKEQLVDALAATISRPTWIIGWSMGGNVAIEIAHRYPEKVLGLCLLASTPKFVGDSGWLVGLPEANYETFRQGVLANVEKALHKFDVLQTRGDANAKNLRHALQQYRQQQQQWSQTSLVHGLKLLGEFDQRSLLPRLALPMLWCFGELDALVNAYTAYEVKELCPLADVQVIRQATHALFLTHPDTFFRALLRLLDKGNKYSLKHKVAESFSRAAGSYDNAAILQRAVAQQLLAEVEVVPGFLLDAGCGTGYCIEQLQHKATCVVGVDIAHGMLLYGKGRYAAMRNVVESDLECLPFAEHSIGQIFSSLAVQWCNAALFLEEWHRILKPGGKVYIATLGENTLHELRHSWAMVDGQRHVNAFLSIEALCEEVYQSPFVLKKMHVENRVLAYGTVKELMHELKNIGAQTVVQGGQKGLMGKQRFARLEQAYETCRNEQGLLPATYEVIYMVLEKHP